MLSLPQGSQEVWEMPIYPPMYCHMPQFQKKTGQIPAPKVEGKVKVLVEKNGKFEEIVTEEGSSRLWSSWQIREQGWPKGTRKSAASKSMWVATTPPCVATMSVEYCQGQPRGPSSDGCAGEGSLPDKEAICVEEGQLVV